VGGNAAARARIARSHRGIVWLSSTSPCLQGVWVMGGEGLEPRASGVGVAAQAEGRRTARAGGLDDGRPRPLEARDLAVGRATPPPAYVRT
jgi:hypothetical protein